MDQAQLSDKERERYGRQIALSEVGTLGQEKLKSSKVAIVGVGGLGSQVALYLAGAGVGEIKLIDGDVVEISNLHRQPIFREDHIGLPKAKAARSELIKLNSEIKIGVFNEHLSASNALSLLYGMNLVIDGTDSFLSRYILSDACEVLRIPQLSASLSPFEGQISLYCAPMEDGSLGPSYRCLYPAPPQGLVRTCKEEGILGPVAGIMGTFLANEALKYLLGFKSDLNGKLIIFDALTLLTKSVEFKRVSSPRSSLLKQEEYVDFCNLKLLKFEISEDALEVRKQRGEAVFILDVREEHENSEERKLDHHIPLRDIPARFSEIPKDRLVVLYCPGEIRSAVAAKKLREEFGFTNVYALTFRN